MAIDDARGFVQVAKGRKCAKGSERWQRGETLDKYISWGHHLKEGGESGGGQ